MDLMKHALSLARKAVGNCSPNPPVGAVLVKDGAVVGEGWTQPPGDAHAEVVAIRQASTKSKGSTLYVTLEPCCFFGRTPPCIRAIIEAGITEAYVGAKDPNPQVNGRGIAELRQAGIKVHMQRPRQEALELIETHKKFITTGLPFVTLKYAMTLDGKIATKTGDSKWITGPQARRYVHQLRASSDAILVGIGTVLADDPQLTARDENDSPMKRQPLRIVVDSMGRAPRTARLFKEPGNALIATTATGSKAASRIPSTEAVHLPGKGGQVDLQALMQHLGQRGVASLLVEAGGTLAASLFEQGLVDKVVAFVSPIIVGGNAAPSPVEGSGIDKMSQAFRLTRVRLERFGSDVAIIGYCGD